MDARQVAAGALLIGISSVTLPAAVPPPTRTALLLAAIAALVFAAGLVSVRLLQPSELG